MERVFFAASHRRFLFQGLVVLFEVELQLVVLQVHELVDPLAQLHLYRLVLGIDPHFQQGVLLAFAEDHSHHLRRLKLLA